MSDVELMPPLRHVAARLRARAPERGPAEPYACIALLLAPHAGLGASAAGSGVTAGLDVGGPGVERVKAGLQIVLIERATRVGDPWSGHMALPGGRVDPGDESPLAAAIRETQEEIGVTVRPEDLLGELDDVFPRDAGATRFVVRPFVFALRECPPMTFSDEVATALWVPLPELDACACTAEVDHRGSKLAVPAYRCGPHVVWGMTHRVVNGLLELISGLEPENS